MKEKSYPKPVLLFKYSDLLFFVPFLALTFFYLFRVPIGQTPDEPAHLKYIEYIVKFFSLPDYSGSGAAHHPPLYYLAQAPIYAVFNNVYVMRFFSIIFSLLNLIVIKNLIGMIFPSKSREPDLALGTAVFCSLVPMYNFMSMAVSNDLLACLLGSLLIYFTISSLNRPFRKKEFIFWGLTFLVAVLTKIVLWPMVFISGIVVFFTQKEKRSLCLMIFALAGVELFSWFYHNVSLYGKWDILGWGKLMKVDYMLVGDRMIFDNTREWLVLLFHSFWGIFGWFAVYLPLVVYSIIRKSTVIFLLPFVVFIHHYFKTADKTQKISMLIFSSFFVIIFLALVKDNFNFFHPQGRYLFPVISIIGFYYSASIYQVAKLVSKIYFGTYRAIIFYSLILVPLIALNIISAITINNFFLK